MKKLYAEQLDEVAAIFQNKIKELQESEYKESDYENFRIAHENELDKVRSIYSNMIEVIQSTFREKFIVIQRESDGYKKQMEQYKEGIRIYEAQLSKMKDLYEEQLEEVAQAFQKKNASLQYQIDRFKEEICLLLGE